MHHKRIYAFNADTINAGCLAPSILHFFSYKLPFDTFKKIHKDLNN